jgi:hypothetical protein
VSFNPPWEHVETTASEHFRTFQASILHQDIRMAHEIIRFSSRDHRGVISMLRQGSVQITLTEAQRKMVVRSLATTMENLRSHPGESLLNFEFREWMELIGQFATAEETSKFVPSLCK